jgi:predicted nucleotidyltransferase
MLPQEVMIEKARELCDRDEPVVSALMYGSFAIGEGDRFSDIEFYLFFVDEPPKACRRKRGSARWRRLSSTMSRSSATAPPSSRTW